jgi:hypothetical protein
MATAVCCIASGHCLLCGRLESSRVSGDQGDRVFCVPSPGLIAQIMHLTSPPLTALHCARLVWAGLV